MGTLVVLVTVLAQQPAAAPAACKIYKGAGCCEATVTQHLTKEAVFGACGESDATYLGEQASKDSCKYFFKGAGAPEGESFVQLYVQTMKEVPSEPSDPFFKWKKVGRVFMTDKAASPKAAPMLASGTGLWLPGNGFMVSVNASTKVCTKPEAAKLARSLK